MSLFNELKRRNVFKVGAAYVIVAWLILQVADVILNNISAPGWVFQVILLLLGMGFLLALFFAWAFEMTPQGLKRESEVDRSESITPQTGKKLNNLIVAVMALAIAYFVIDKFVLSADRERAAIETALQEATTQAAVEPASLPESAAGLDKSIAVLPFVDMSQAKDQEYLSDGLAEELLNLLAKIPEMRVTSRSSAFAFKGEKIDIPEVAQKLGVAYILEGSVRKAGNRVRVTAQLIEARSDIHLWSETYDRQLDDIFAIQDEISAKVVQQLKIKLLGEAPHVKATDPEAFTHYLQARQLMRQNSEDSLEQSIAKYRQALSIDPGYAAAWSGLAATYNTQMAAGIIPISEGYKLALEAAKRALELDPNDATALAELSFLSMTMDRDLAATARYLDRALELEPGNTEILRSAINLFRVLGRLDKAIAVAEYSITLDPVNNSSYYLLGLMNRYSGRLDAAIEAFQTALHLSPGRMGANYGISEALMLKGEPEAALASAIQEGGDSVWGPISFPMIYHALGREADSDAALARLIEEEEMEAAYNIAYVLAYRGEVDRAFEWLDKAVEYNDPGLGDLPIESLFSNIHDDPRWLPFLESIGKSPAQLDSIEFDVALPK